MFGFGSVRVGLNVKFLRVEENYSDGKINNKNLFLFISNIRIYSSILEVLNRKFGVFMEYYFLIKSLSFIILLFGSFVL